MPTVSQVVTPGMIQGIAAPNVIVNPQLFYKATRRMRFSQVSKTAIAGMGSTDPVSLRQTGIISALEVHVLGTASMAVSGTGVCTRDYPLNLLKRARLSANGQSNLIDCRGVTLRAHEFATNPKINDRGITKYVGATTYSNGTLALASDDWGTGTTQVMAPGHTPGTSTDTYNIDLTYVIPVAADQVSLIGSLFAQTTATNLALELEWASEADMFTASGETVTWTIYYEVAAVAYSIPNVDGQFVVPDVTTFHQISEFRKPVSTSGEVEILLPGTGVGRKLLRVMGNIYSSAAPLTVNATNYSGFAWRYGGNDTPENWSSGQTLRALNERQTGCDLGGVPWGIWMLDFASEHALRDVVDEGMTSDLRIVPSMASAPTAGYAQVAQETLFLAPVGA